MQTRSFFSADITHLCLRAEGSWCGRRPAWIVFPEYGAKSLYQNPRKPWYSQPRNVSDHKRVTAVTSQIRNFYHGSRRLTTVVLGGLRDDEVHDRRASQPSSNPGTSFGREPTFRIGAAHSISQGKLARGTSPERYMSREPRAFYTTFRGVKTPYTTPTVSLALWLDAKSDEERLHVWNTVNRTDGNWKLALPAILLQFIHKMNTTRASEMVVASDTLHPSEAEVLRKSGFSIDDVHLWASITTASTDEEAAQRYLASPRAKPIFVLLEVLRRPRLSAASFRLLLLHSWDRCLGVNAEHLVPQLESGVNYQLELNPESLKSNLPQKLEELTFMILIRRLRRHSRQVWAPAVTGISHMFIVYWKQISADRVSSDNLLSSKLHARISKAYNLLIRILATPASTTPMQSMHHNWDAQRLLLESAGQFSPPLLLNQPSYRAVTRVLLALKKSDGEGKYAGLLRRSWPPWRKDQDGMDVERPPEDDISRVVSASFRMKEAGYEEESIDKAIRVLGGRESDGTPTIPTRAVVGVKRRDIRLSNHKMARFTDSTIKLRGTVDESAARIIATRDAREAWAAFLSLSEIHGRPTYSMYHAMLEKLIYHAKAGNQIRDSEILPGSLKEPIPLPDDNMSESERSRTQPPDFQKLYTQMIQEGILPAGRFLEMLIVNSTSPDEVRIYLQDSGMSERDARILTQGSHQTDLGDLERIPARIIMSFIKFLSKRARSYRPTTSQENPMAFAFDLVRHFRFSSPVALYDLIIGLSHPGLHFSVDHSRCRARMTAWGLIAASLRDFQDYGGDLNPYGLRLVCRALETSLPAFDILYKTVPAPNRSGLQVVKEIFRSLSTSVTPTHGLPGLLHDFGGSHLHAYVRVLCLSHDMEEIISLLKWMIQHQKELESTAEQRGNGGILLRRTLIAIRALLERHNANDRARIHEMEGLVNQLDGWGGWPTSREVAEYLDNDMHSAEGSRITRDIADETRVG